MSTKTNTTALKENVAILQTEQDMKTALLIVSLMVNLFIFTAWLVIQADPTLALVILSTS